jgi:hypothetical protein
MIPFETIKVFKELQGAKIERAQRLLNIVTRIGAAEAAGDKDVAAKGLKILAEHLPILLVKIKSQRKLCGHDNQCIALIDQEVAALEARDKALGTSVIDHVKNAAQGLVRLEVFPVSNALLLIIGREKSLGRLYETIGTYAA